MVVMLTNALVSLQVGRLLVRLFAVWPFARVARHRCSVDGNVVVEAPTTMTIRYLYPTRGWCGSHASAENV
jgi:hypothetical protein